MHHCFVERKGTISIVMLAILKPCTAACVDSDWLKGTCYLIVTDRQTERERESDI